MPKRIDEFWWAPVLVRKNPRARPQLLKSYTRTTRKEMIHDFTADAYNGKHDWKYCRKLGWQAVRVRITSGPLASPPGE